MRTRMLAAMMPIAKWTGTNCTRRGRDAHHNDAQSGEDQKGNGPSFDVGMPLR